MTIQQEPTCFCFSLELGVKLIGCIELIVYTAYLIACSIGIAWVDNHNSYPQVQTLYGLFVALLILTCISPIIIGIFLYGTHKRKILLLRPWMVFAVVDFLLCLTSVLVCSINLDKAYDVVEDLMLTIIILAGIWMICKGYFFLVIYKYHKMLMELELERLKQYGRALQRNNEIDTQSDVMKNV